MFIHHIVVGPFDHPGPMRLILETTDRLVHVGQVLLDADIVLVRAKNAIIVPVQQDLTGLGSDGLEMPGRNALSRDIPNLRGSEKAFEDLLTGCPRMSLQIRLRPTDELALP